MNLPQIKIYEIDYQFIIDNYTNPKLWDKVWNLFVFKNYIYTITLSSIDVKKYEISFEIRLESDLDVWDRNKTAFIKYNLKNSTIEILKKQINGTLFTLAEWLEKVVIENSSEYRQMEDSKYSERNLLEEIAKDFLDENNVTNSEIRDVYIDYYVDKNETIYERLDDLEDEMRYNYLTDLFLIIAECSNDETRKNKVLENQNNEEKIQQILGEVDEYMKYIETEDWTSEMREKLEAI